jgi:hypothetical protein
LNPSQAPTRAPPAAGANPVVLVLAAQSRFTEVARQAARDRRFRLQPAPRPRLGSRPLPRGFACPSEVGLPRTPDFKRNPRRTRSRTSRSSRSRLHGGRPAPTCIRPRRRARRSSSVTGPAEGSRRPISWRRRRRRKRRRSASCWSSSPTASQAAAPHPALRSSTRLGSRSSKPSARTS